MQICDMTPDENEQAERIADGLDPVDAAVAEICAEAKERAAWLESIARLEREVAERGPRLAAWCEEHGITLEQLAIARAAAVEKMRGPRTDGLHLVKVDAKDAFTPPLRANTAELDAAFARFVESHLRSIRLDRCGPYPRKLRVIARWRWRRKMRALKALDAHLVATIVALGRER